MQDATEQQSEAVSRRSVGTRDVTTWGTALGRQLADAHGRLAGHIGPHPALVVSLAVGAGIATAAAIAATTIFAAGIARAFGPVGLPVMGLAAAGLIAAKERSRTPLVLVAAAGIGSLLMTLGGKDVIKRHRPPHRDAIPPFERSPSFPSGHTLNTTTVAGVLAYLLVLRESRTGPQVATIAGAATTALTVGLSRVLLGAHWFTDVLVGWVGGSGWLALIITSHRLHLTAESGRPAPGRKP
jgi:undecaprenyl-diphosphatase